MPAPTLEGRALISQGLLWPRGALLRAQNFDMATLDFLLLTALCHLPYQEHLAIDAILIKTQGTICHLDDWPIVFLGPPLVLPGPGLLSLPGSH